jgi:hypothetical protein
MQTRDERLKEISKLKGTRHQRKLNKFSDGFNKIFKFFYLVCRKEIITFCGQQVEVSHDVNEKDAKLTFRCFEDGHYNKGQKIITKHPNIVQKVIIGKKGWGLWKDQWAQGIADWTFDKEEILNEFKKKGIEIPEQFLKEFDDFILKYKQKRYL